MRAAPSPSTALPPPTARPGRPAARRAAAAGRAEQSILGRGFYQGPGALRSTGGRAAGGGGRPGGGGGGGGGGLGGGGGGAEVAWHLWSPRSTLIPVSFKPL